MQNVYVCYAKRTAIGKLSGGFAKTPAPMLGAALVRDAMLSTGLAPDTPQEILMGQVLTAGVGQAPARQTAIYGGLANSVCATTVGRVCGSGLKAIMLADQSLRLGDTSIVFAGGQENMTLSPHILPNARAGYRFGSVELLDSMQYDGLTDPYAKKAMGTCGEVLAKERNFSREEQDAYARQSYERARRAIEEGAFSSEILAVEVMNRKGPLLIDRDEEPFDVDLERLSSLKPAFGGTITAGNASSLNDGAALTVLTNDTGLKQYPHLKPFARVIAQQSFAHDPQYFTTAPIECARRLLKKANLRTDDIGLWEINEAFALVAMAAQKDLMISSDRLNVKGGAVALGHPIGCSGARIVVTLIHALKPGQKGVAALCIGGGEASALLIEKC